MTSHSRILPLAACPSSNSNSAGADAAVVSRPDASSLLDAASRLDAASGADASPQPDAAGTADAGSSSGVVTAIALGYAHSCARMMDGTARCWGENAFTFNDGTDTDRSIAVQVGGISGVEQIGLGERYSCARLTGGTVTCFGRINGQGKLGDGTMTGERMGPVAVVGLIDVVDLSVGVGGNSIAILADRTARGWGRNTSSALGDGTTVNRSTPVTLPGLVNIAQVSILVNHGCAVLRDKTLWCWGSNQEAQITGDSSRMEDRLFPTPRLIPIANVEEVAAAGRCARLGDGTVQCWGANSEGQIADGTILPRPSPTTIAGLADVRQFEMSVDHACALLGDGTVKCWGLNDHGQLGDGTTSNRRVVGPIVLGL